MGPIKRTLSALTLGIAGAGTTGWLKNLIEVSVKNEMDRRAVEHQATFYSNVISPVSQWVNESITHGSLEKVVDNVETGLMIMGFGYLLTKAVRYGKRQINITTKY